MAHYAFASTTVDWTGVTIRGSNRLPMDECTDSLEKATVFSTLDANSGYWRIEIDEGNQEKTALTSNCRPHLFMKMAFGLKNALATFQMAMNVIVASVRWLLAVIYLDDIAVFSQSPMGRIEQVQRVMRLLYEAGVTPKLNKCVTFCWNYRLPKLLYPVWPPRTCRAYSRHGGKIRPPHYMDRTLLLPWSGQFISMLYSKYHPPRSSAQ